MIAPPLPLDPARHYARNPRAVAITSGGSALWSLPGAPVLRCPDVSAAGAAGLWEALAAPLPGHALSARIEADPESPALARLVETLLAGTFVLRGAPDELTAAPPESPATPPVHPRPCARLVVGVTGAVQAAFVAPALRRLALDFATTVDVVLTRSARRFITPHAVAALGVGVWTDAFERRHGVRVPHAHLAEAAELVLVLPASAGVIFRLAHGACSDLLSLVVAGTRAPVVVAPSMSAAMWRHPPVRRNVARLRDDGIHVIEPGPGRSIASDETAAVGGLGLGGDHASLIAALTAVLDLSR